MTTKSYKVYSGMPFSYKIQKDRYFYVDVLKSVSNDTTDNITLEANTGLEVSFDNKLVTISAGLLPDKSEFAGMVGYYGDYNYQYLYNNQIYKGLVHNKDSLTPDLRVQYNFETKDTLLGLEKIDGYIWAGDTLNRDKLYAEDRCNFTVSGSPTFNGHVVSGITADNYLGNSFVTPEDNNVEIIAKLVINTSSNYQICFADTLLTSHLIKVFKGNVGMLTPNSGDMGSFTVATNDVVWVKLVISSDNCIQYVIKDSGYTLDTLPDISQWTKNVETTDKVINSGEIKYTIGINNDTKYSTQYWRGSVDLDGFIVKNKQGDVLWKPLGEL